MSRRRVQLVAVLITMFSVVEIALSVVAIGHRHSPVPKQLTASRTGPRCSHGLEHGHSYPLAASDGAAPDGSSDSQESSDGDCSICRYLAQLALPNSWTVDSVSYELVQVVVQVTQFDVAAPAHLLPQPRSPPAAA